MGGPRPDFSDRVCAGPLLSLSVVTFTPPSLNTSDDPSRGVPLRQPMPGSVSENQEGELVDLCSLGGPQKGKGG